jgi:Ca2+-binding EF-hand superfamily protein
MPSAGASLPSMGGGSARRALGRSGGGGSPQAGGGTGSFATMRPTAPRVNGQGLPLAGGGSYSPAVGTTSRARGRSRTNAGATNARRAELRQSSASPSRDGGSNQLLQGGHGQGQHGQQGHMPSLLRPASAAAGAAFSSSSSSSSSSSLVPASALAAAARAAERRPRSVPAGRGGGGGGGKGRQPKPRFGKGGGSNPTQFGQGDAETNVSHVKSALAAAAAAAAAEAAEAAAGDEGMSGGAAAAAAAAAAARAAARAAAAPSLRVQHHVVHHHGAAADDDDAGNSANASDGGGGGGVNSAVAGFGADVPAAMVEAAVRKAELLVSAKLLPAPRLDGAAARGRGTAGGAVAARLAAARAASAGERRGGGLVIDEKQSGQSGKGGGAGGGTGGAAERYLSMLENADGGHGGFNNVAYDAAGDGAGVAEYGCSGLGDGAGSVAHTQMEDGASGGGAAAATATPTDPVSLGLLSREEDVLVRAHYERAAVVGLLGKLKEEAMSRFGSMRQVRSRRASAFSIFYLLARSLARSLAHSLTHSLTHSSTCCSPLLSLLYLLRCDYLCRALLRHPACHQMFSAIDADGGGDIDRVEFGAALARAGVAHAVSEREAGLVFDALDADGSGAISYPEFAALFDAALLGRAMAQAGGGGGVAAGGEVRFGREARGASTQPKLRKQNKNNNNSSNNQADRSDAAAAAAAAAADDDDADDDDDAARYAPSAITPRSYYDLSRLKQRVAEKIVAKSAASKTAYRSHTQELLNTFQQLDENMDGYLSCADLQTALTSSEGGLNLGCSERQVRALLAAADTDGDQLVSYAEFIDFLSVKDVETSYSPFFDGACASLARSRPTD